MIVKNVDVYSLGMLMPVLFYNVGLLEKIKESEIIKRFLLFWINGKHICLLSYEN